LQCRAHAREILATPNELTASEKRVKIRSLMATLNSASLGSLHGRAHQEHSQYGKQQNDYCRYLSSLYADL
jgi:hypothetical protein